MGNGLETKEIRFILVDPEWMLILRLLVWVQIRGLSAKTENRKIIVQTAETNRILLGCLIEGQAYNWVLKVLQFIRAWSETVV